MPALVIFRPTPNRSGVRAAFALLAGLAFTGSSAFAGDSKESVAPPAAAVSASDTNRVFVSGVPGSFERVREAVARAKAQTGRDYRVFILGNAGDGPDAAKRALDGIIDRWTEAAASGGATGFDPSNDVTILLDVHGKAIAVRAPWGLEVVSGLEPETIEQELVQKVFMPLARAGKYDEGLAAMVDSTEAWVKARSDREQARAEAARVFRTRTLPIGLASLAAFGGLAALAVQRSRHDRRIHEARKKLAAFKSEVVALSDLLDAQQERHRMLPHSDPDFKTPMQGLTRTAFDGVQQSIRRYRERWLSLMDVWEKAQEEIEAEWFLGTASAEKAIGMLDAAEARPPLDAVVGECRTPLDALESAHEKARELSEGLERAIAAAKEKLATLAGRGRSAAVFQGPLATVERGLESARHELEADPVAARGRLEESRSSLDESVARVERLESVDDRMKKSQEETRRISQKVAVKRSEGWLLSEPGAIPDERLSEAAKQTETAAGLLDAGEIDSAERHVERAEHVTAEADTMLENVVAAKARVEDLLPGCEARLSALEARHAHAERALEHLAAGYAERSWSDVAGNLDKASEGLSRSRELIAEARAAAEPSRQYFFRAVALAEEAVRQQEWVDGCYSAITDRRMELDGLKASLPGRTEAVARKTSQLLGTLERQRTDRVRANEHAQEAEQLVRNAADLFGRPRPDLPAVSAMVDAGDAAATRAGELAAEDDRLARQAIEQIDETENGIRRVAAWYEEGVSADVRPATSLWEQAKALLSRQRYEDAIKASSEASRLARQAYAVATAEATRRRQQRMAEIQRRQLEESFVRMSRGAGPWVIQLPGGAFTGPDPWRSMGAAPSRPRPQPSARTAGGSWANETVQVNW